MISVLTDFEERVKEIELYFEHLNLILSKNAVLYLPQNKTKRQRIIDPELIKVLKANCFLILYNLSESSIRQAIAEIYSQISNENLKYSSVKDEIKKIWIASKYKNFNKMGIDGIFEVLSNIANDIIEINFETTNSNLGGNVDGQKIRGFANTLGFSLKVHHSLNNGAKLHDVKIQRNQLAHGEISFSKCGRNYTIEDLIKTKDHTIKYLRKILKNINAYLESKKFKS